MKTLIVIDMQNDFVTGTLGSEEAVAILPNIKAKIDEYISSGNEVIFTRDTHNDGYLYTNEGKHLPIPHCIKNTKGWQIVKEIDRDSCEHIDKNTFGYLGWRFRFDDYTYPVIREFDEIEIVGVHTETCVVSNALILKAQFPKIDITVNAKCCAGITPEMHEAALKTMGACQIKIVAE